MRARHDLLVIVVLTACACGISVVGLPGGGDSTSTPTSDGGGSSSSSSSSSSGSSSGSDADPQFNDSGSDAAPFDCLKERLDPTVTKCVDFDEPASKAPPKFSFDNITNTPGQTIALAPSQPNLGVGNALLIGLGDGIGSRDAWVNNQILTNVTFGTKNVTIDTNIVLDQMGADYYAALLSFQIAGADCQDGLSGVGVTTGTGLPTLRWSNDLSTILTTIQFGVPFHLRLTARPTSGQTKDTEAFVNGKSVGKTPVKYGPQCNYGGLWLGTFFTKNQQAAISARFDQVVVRVE